MYSVAPYGIEVVMRQVYHSPGTIPQYGQEFLVPALFGGTLPGQFHRFHRRGGE
jgi:hypothetical protein